MNFGIMTTFFHPTSAGCELLSAACNCRRSIREEFFKVLSNSGATFGSDNESRVTLYRVGDTLHFGFGRFVWSMCGCARLR